MMGQIGTSTGGLQIFSVKRSGFDRFGFVVSPDAASYKKVIPVNFEGLLNISATTYLAKYIHTSSTLKVHLIRGSQTYYVLRADSEFITSGNTAILVQPGDKLEFVMSFIGLDKAYDAQLTVDLTEVELA